MANVYRIGRHEKIVEIKSYLSRHQMMSSLQNQIRYLNCHKVEYLEIDEDHVKVLCIEKP